jgi:probable HAF family extracellular repeat protein
MRTGALAFAISLMLAACSDGGGGGGSDSFPFPDNPSPTTGGTSTGSITIPVKPINSVTRYSVTFLPSGNGSITPLAELTAINNKGQVAGDIDGLSAGPTWASHAFLSTGGSTLDLGTLGGSDSHALGLNDAGQVVGASLTNEDVWRAFLYTNGAMANLGTLGGTYSAAYSVNVAGEVVGESETTDGRIMAFLYANGAMRELGTLGGANSIAFAVNSLHQVVGASETSAKLSHAFVYRNGKMADLGTLGGDASGATDINDKSLIVGWSDVRYESGVQYVAGFLYSNGAMTPIRATTSQQEVWPFAISNSGVVVGEVSETEDDDGFAFVWDRINGMRNLNDLIDPALGCTIYSAFDINDFGKIVAIGDCAEGNYEWEEQTVGFLLTPVR